MKQIFFPLIALACVLGACSLFEKDDDSETAAISTNTYSISYAAPQNGTLSVSKTVAVSAGITITLTLTPDDGYQISSVTVYSTTTEQAVPTTQSSTDDSVYTFTMPEGDVTVTALFAPAPTYTVTYADGVDNEYVTVPTDTGTYWEGKKVYVRFTGVGTRSGYTFTGWAESSGSTEATYTAGGTSSFIMGSENITLYAVWKSGESSGYIGEKAPTEEKAVGDIIFTDGSALSYSDTLTLTDEQLAAAVAVVFYAGSSSDALGKKALAVGLTNTVASETKADQTKQWAPKSTTGYKHNFSALQCMRSSAAPTDGTACYAYSEGTYTYYFTGDFDGSDNWEAVCKDDEAGTAEAASTQQEPAYRTNYPAFYWIQTYAENTGLSDTAYSTGWYLPTAVELHILYSARETVNAAITLAGGTALSLSHYYWTASQHVTTSYYVWRLRFYTGKFDYAGGKDNTAAVCAVRAIY